MFVTPKTYLLALGSFTAGTIQSHRHAQKLSVCCRMSCAFHWMNRARLKTCMQKGFFVHMHQELLGFGQFGVAITEPTLILPHGL